MRELERSDLERCFNQLPAEGLWDLLTILRSKPGQLVVAGGFVRDSVLGETCRDVDVFAADADVAKRSALEFDQLLHESGEEPLVKASRYAVTVKWNDAVAPVQFIHRRPFTDPSDVIKTFDFTVSQGSFWWAGGWHSAVSDRFYEDVRAKRIRYTSPVREEEIGGSFLRVLKLYRRGYVASLDSLGKIVTRFARAWKVDGTEDELWKVLAVELRAADAGAESADHSNLDKLDYLRDRD
jgi:hypothetical protein